MQKTNHNIEKDNFRKIIKEKLEGYSLPVNDDIWNKIEKNLDNKPRKTVIWSWISGTAVAAAIALFALSLHLISDKHIDYEATNPVSEHAETISENVPLEPLNQTVSTPDVKPEKIYVPRKTKKEYADVLHRVETDIIKSESVPDDKPETSLPISDDQTKNAQTEKANPLKKLIYSNTDPFGEDAIPVKKSRARKSIGLSFGSGGNLLAMNTNSADNSMHDGVFGQLRSNFYDKNIESLTKERILIEDFPDVTHRAPLSFGLTVKRELNRTFSLETGLVYTFLDSRFENRNWEKKALLQLHYIGLPVNIQARLLGNRKSDWEIYLSAGGMVEKGIYSHYKQTNYAENSDITIVSNEKIDGLQYSLSFAPGIDYTVYRNYSIYLEPKISYYFDNNQPVSARTKHPLVVGINAGLRVCW